LTGNIAKDIIRDKLRLQEVEEALELNLELCKRATKPAVPDIGLALGATDRAISASSGAYKKSHATATHLLDDFIVP